MPAWAWCLALNQRVTTDHRRHRRCLGLMPRLGRLAKHKKWILICLGCDLEENWWLVIEHAEEGVVLQYCDWWEKSKVGSVWTGTVVGLITAIHSLNYVPELCCSIISGLCTYLEMKEDKSLAICGITREDICLTCDSYCSQYNVLGCWLNAKLKFVFSTIVQFTEEHNATFCLSLGLVLLNPNMCSGVLQTYIFIRDFFLNELCFRVLLLHQW